MSTRATNTGPPERGLSAKPSFVVRVGVPFLAAALISLALGYLRDWRDGYGLAALMVVGGIARATWWLWWRRKPALTRRGETFFLDLRGGSHKFAAQDIESVDISRGDWIPEFSLFPLGTMILMRLRNGEQYDFDIQRSPADVRRYFAATLAAEHCPITGEERGIT